MQRRDGTDDDRNDVGIENDTGCARFQHVVTQWLKNAAGSAINHIMNGTGAAVNSTNTGATTPN